MTKVAGTGIPVFLGDTEGRYGGLERALFSRESSLFWTIEQRGMLLDNVKHPLAAPRTDTCAIREFVMVG